MSFGLTNAPASFQRMMTMILDSEIGKTFSCFSQRHFDLFKHKRTALCDLFPSGGKWSETEMEEVQGRTSGGRIPRSHHLKPVHQTIADESS